MASFNEVLASELSAYRFVGGKLVPVSSEQEMQAIERAIAETSGAYSTASEHLQHVAVTLLARRPKPDYRNSIKESISAVEALCAVITGNQKATLGQALKVIDEEARLHGALRSAFEKLYGYTSDADGIRHALMEETTIEQEDAIFMLVACSAFVSYVIAKRARKSLSRSLGSQPATRRWHVLTTLQKPVSGNPVLSETGLVRTELDGIGLYCR